MKNFLMKLFLYSLYTDEKNKELCSIKLNLFIEINNKNNKDRDKEIVIYLNKLISIYFKTEPIIKNKNMLQRIF